jgi:mannose-6-phosphate isomerase-like protein (cupin superfamily)
MEPAMELEQIPHLQERRKQSGKLYLEFLRADSLSMGIYELAAGTKDPQQPHREDEVYYVISGRGMIHIDGEDRPVAAGTVVFVRAGLEHRFHSIKEDLTLLVFFAPAESSQS